MTKSFVVILLFLFCATSAFAQATGLNNRTKKFTNPVEMTGNEATIQAEIERSWQAALVRVPLGKGRSKPVSVAGLNAKNIAELKGEQFRLPAIVFLHGCSGITAGTKRRMRFFASQGFVVVAPASFARLKYPQSCNPSAFRGGLYRDTLKLRQEDAAYAIEKMAALPFVRSNAIVLMGFSQGGVTAATFKPRNRNQRVAARVIEGWTCHASWPEYEGVNAPSREPVLSLVALGDPWFQNPWSKGDCGAFLQGKPNSQSIVYKNPPLSFSHGLLDYVLPQKQVMIFLKAVLDLP